MNLHELRQELRKAADRFWVALQTMNELLDMFPPLEQPNLTDLLDRQRKNTVRAVARIKSLVEQSIMLPVVLPDGWDWHHTDILRSCEALLSASSEDRYWQREVQPDSIRYLNIEGWELLTQMETLFEVQISDDLAPVDQSVQTQKTRAGFGGGGEALQSSPPKGRVQLYKDDRILDWGEERFERLTDKMLKVLEVFVEAYDRGRPIVKLSDHNLTHDGAFLRQAFKLNRKGEPNVHPVSKIFEMVAHGEYRIKDPEN